MCTTFLAYKIVNYLKKEKVNFLDYPKLVRFNPNIPWKTRGNGAVGLKIETQNPQKIKKKIKDFVIKYSDTKNGANPALVFYENDAIPNEFKKFSEIALCELVNRNYAKKFATKNLESFYLGNGQGLVGAIGVIGYQFDDQTVELLSYRTKPNFGKKRIISKESVKKMKEKTYPFTFNSFDETKNKILISPHGPDPVFYGIRGENTKSLLKAAKLIKTKEKLDGYLIFKSNQGTSAHLKNEINVSELKPYSSGNITGFVFEEPKMERGGHVFFSIISNGKKVRCAVYEPTGLASEMSYLKKGDKVMIGGAVRKASKKHPRIVNIELVKILKLKKNLKLTNPSCTQCDKKMKSKGKNQGFQCVKCGKKAKSKKVEEIRRKIKRQTYLPIASAHRHLTRPRQRIGILNKDIQFDNSVSWFRIFKN
jgi:tRNA(Ile2)-agmatinylcytidine synthase